MAKGIILGKPGDADLPSPGAITQDDIDRAAAAVANAPTTESGIVIPPHVAEEQQAPQHTGPNRAQRRAQKQWQRRKGRASKQPRHKPTAAEKRAQAAAAAREELSSYDRAADLLNGATDELEREIIERMLRRAGGVDLG